MSSPQNPEVGGGRISITPKYVGFNYNPRYKIPTVVQTALEEGLDLLLDLNLELMCGSS